LPEQLIQLRQTNASPAEIFDARDGIRFERGRQRVQPGRNFNVFTGY